MSKHTPTEQINHGDYVVLTGVQWATLHRYGIDVTIVYRVERLTDGPAIRDVYGAHWYIYDPRGSWDWSATVVTLEKK